jgi:hypothetical protein
MATQDRHGGNDPPATPAPRNRRVHRTVERRSLRSSTVDVEPQGQPVDPDEAPEQFEPAATAEQPSSSVISAADPGALGDSDWMTLARLEAEAEAARAAAADWAPGARVDLDEDEFDLAGASLVRPYARTGGRTKPVRHLDLEALVHTTVSGKEASTSPWLTPEHTNIIEMCTGTVSVAEIAARLAVPIGVARVIIADMVDLGLVEVMKTSAAEGDERDPDFLRRVLSGLQRL